MSRIRLLALPSAVLVLVLGLGLAPTARALLIDSFDDAQGPFTANSGGNSGGPITGSMIGGERQVNVIWDSGPNDVTAEVDAGGSSVFNFSTGADTLGRFSIGYGEGTIGGNDLQDLDFTESGAQTGIAIVVAFDDLPIDLRLFATSDGGADGSQFILPLPGGIFGPTVFFVPFASFATTAGSGADFTAVDTFGLDATTSFPATDLQLDFVETTVPEPGTALLVMGGLLGLATRRRRP